MAPPSDARPRDLAWWETRAFAYAMILVAAVPLLWPAIPPLTDLMGHMGRYRVQIDLPHSADLQRYWNFEWALIGNLGVDLFVQLLGPLIGLEPAVKLVVLMIPPLTVAGMLLLAREEHGRVPPTTLFALPLAYGYPFQFGFVNFALGMSLALLAFAFWLRLARQNWLIRWRPLIFLAIGFVIWVVHSFAWGTLGLLCFIAEFVRARRAKTAMLPAIWRAGIACLPLAPPALLLLPWRGSEAPKGTFDWFNWWAKWNWLRSILRDRWMAFDLASAGVVAAVILSGFPRFWRRFDGTLGAATLVLALTFVLLPRVLLSSAYADMRLAPYAVAFAVLALKPARNRKLAGIVAALGLAFVLVRTAATTISFAKYEAGYETQLPALDHVATGSRVMVLVATPCSGVWSTRRTEHMGSMAIVRRNAFTNDQWVVPGAQLLTLRYHASGRYFSHDPSQLLRLPECRKRGEALFDATLRLFPRNVFDYLWMIDVPRSRWPRGDKGLIEVWNGGESGVLYRVPDPIPAPPPPPQPPVEANGADNGSDDGSATASRETPNGTDSRVTR